MIIKYRINKKKKKLSTRKDGKKHFEIIFKEAKPAFESIGKISFSSANASKLQHPS